MEDDLKKNGRRPEKKWKTTWKKMEEDLKKKKKNLFWIPLKFRDKPFLGLAQLSEIFYFILN